MCHKSRLLDSRLPRLSEGPFCLSLCPVYSLFATSFLQWSHQCNSLWRNPPTKMEPIQSWILHTKTFIDKWKIISPNMIDVLNMNYSDDQVLDQPTYITPRPLSHLARARSFNKAICSELLRGITATVPTKCELWGAQVWLDLGQEPMTMGIRSCLRNFTSHDGKASMRICSYDPKPKHIIYMIKFA